MRRIESRSDQRVGEEHDAELAGIDSLETTSTLSITPWAKAWTTLWPKLAAVGLLLIAWQLVVLSG